MGDQDQIKEDSETGENKTDKGGGILISPILYYQPETRIAFGLAGNVVFRLSKKGKRKRPSIIAPLFIYTQNKQIRGLVKADLYLYNNAYHIISEIKYQDFPDKFFGVGSNVPDTHEESYTAKTLDFYISILKRVTGYLNLGVRYDFSNLQIREIEKSQLLDSGEIPGSEGSRLSGLSLLLNFDSRNNIFFPSRGYWLKFTAGFYNKILGSQFNYETYRLDLRRYIPLFSDSGHVLALQGLVQTQYGTVPFHKMSRMGGQNIMRGYYDGRYRERNLVVLQAEYRFPVFWRIGAVAFAGMGDVSHRFRDFTLDNVKYSYGFGLRYLFNKKEDMYIRFDLGFGNNGASAFYFSVFEAF